MGGLDGLLALAHQDRNAKPAHLRRTRRGRSVRRGCGNDQPPYILITSPYIFHCLGACIIASSLFSLQGLLAPQLRLWTPPQDAARQERAARRRGRAPPFDVQAVSASAWVPRS